MTQSRTRQGAKTVIAAACIGNFLEFYNFMAFAFFAPMIGHAFFPSGNHLMSLLYSLMTFAVGFFVRPLGALTVGKFAHRYSQRAALMLTFSLMGAGSLLLALTPETETIGLLAPVMIVIARLLQGFSDGGEVGPATTLIFDAAPQGLGGVFGTIQYMTQLMGTLVAVLIGLALSLSLSHDALYAWGWRVPFLIGLVIVPVGIILRRRAAGFDHATSEHPPIGPEDRSVIRRAVPLIFFCITSGTISTYLRNFGVSYAVAVLHLSPAIGMTGMAAGLLIGSAMLVPGMWFAARLTDPRLFVISVGIVTALVSIPLYYFAIHSPGVGSQIVLNIALFMLSSLVNGCIWKTLLESLPASSRSFVFGIVYALAVSSFGGLTQPFITWLVAVTENPMMPAYLMLLTVPLGTIPWLLLLRLTEQASVPVSCHLSQQNGPDANGRVHLSGHV
ncbi:MFS transporter [Acetobacter senegalensis]|uniref:MFS transporter n=1 Tax=Acetobacter senegalensis TaxID=446692 RepID=UPI00128D6F4E|nr:MFS transporter [Acetobacter senegalensis]MCG4256367.1 MFS transporter [Acetobacter senegalensis]MCG4266075.1 MFS transporter [Acetobacter senegalensis]MPQ73061.1 MFS transporter [Acetobacter senegalensis]